jgi:hypothetical protein
VLESLGVNLEKVRSEVIKVLTQSGATPHHGERRTSKTPPLTSSGSTSLLRHAPACWIRSSVEPMKLSEFCKYYRAGARTIRL